MVGRRVSSERAQCRKGSEHAECREGCRRGERREASERGRADEVGKSAHGEGYERADEEPRGRDDCAAEERCRGWRDGRCEKRGKVNERAMEGRSEDGNDSTSEVHAPPPVPMATMEPRERQFTAADEEPPVVWSRVDFLRWKLHEVGWFVAHEQLESMVDHLNPTCTDDEWTLFALCVTGLYFDEDLILERRPDEYTNPPPPPPQPYAINQAVLDTEAHEGKRQQHGQEWPQQEFERPQQESERQHAEVDAVQHHVADEQYRTSEERQQKSADAEEGHHCADKQYTEEHRVAREQRQAEHERIMQQYADNRLAEDERMERLVQALAKQQREAAEQPVHSEFRMDDFTGDTKDVACDDFKNWLTLYERGAKLFNYTEVHKLFYLQVKLKGTALSYFDGLPEETQTDYDALTIALSRRFRDTMLTTARYKEAFDCKMGNTETVADFNDRLRMALNRITKATPINQESLHKHLFIMNMESDLMGIVLPEVDDKMTTQQLYELARTRQQANNYLNELKVAEVHNEVNGKTSKPSSNNHHDLIRGCQRCWRQRGRVQAYPCWLHGRQGRAQRQTMRRQQARMLAPMHVQMTAPMLARAQVQEPVQARAQTPMGSGRSAHAGMLVAKRPREGVEHCRPADDHPPDVPPVQTPVAVADQHKMDEQQHTVDKQQYTEQGRVNRRKQHTVDKQQCTEQGRARHHAEERNAEDEQGRQMALRHQEVEVAEQRCKAIGHQHGTSGQDQQRDEQRYHKEVEGTNAVARMQDAAQPVSMVDDGQTRVEQPRRAVDEQFHLTDEQRRASEERRHAEDERARQQDEQAGQPSKADNEIDDDDAGPPVQPFTGEDSDSPDGGFATWINDFCPRSIESAYAQGIPLDDDDIHDYKLHHLVRNLKGHALHFYQEIHPDNQEVYDDIIQMFLLHFRPPQLDQEHQSPLATTIKGTKRKKNSRKENKGDKNEVENRYRHKTTQVFEERKQDKLCVAYDSGIDVGSSSSSDTECSEETRRNPSHSIKYQHGQGNKDQPRIHQEDDKDLRSHQEEMPRQREPEPDTVRTFEILLKGIRTLIDKTKETSDDDMPTLKASDIANKWTDGDRYRQDYIGKNSRFPIVLRPIEPFSFSRPLVFRYTTSAYNDEDGSSDALIDDTELNDKPTAQRHD